MDTQKVITQETQNVNSVPSELVYDMSEHDYHAIAYRLSKHTLEEFSANPWKFFKLRDNPDKVPSTDSAVFTLGRAVHAAVLTPEVFKRDYVRLPAEIKVKRGKAWDEFKAANEGKEIISPDQAEMCELIATTVAASGSAQDVLKACTRREVTALWTTNSGDLMKSRFDAMSEDGALIADLKTCQDATADHFIRDADSYGYDIQAAVYIDAAYACGLQPEYFAFICVEKTWPFSVAVHKFSPYSEFVQAGRFAYQRMLDSYREMNEAAEILDIVSELPSTINLAPVPWSKRQKAWRSAEDVWEEI